MSVVESKVTYDEMNPVERRQFRLGLCAAYPRMRNCSEASIELYCRSKAHHRAIRYEMILARRFNLPWAFGWAFGLLVQSQSPL